MAEATDGRADDPFGIEGSPRFRVISEKPGWLASPLPFRHREGVEAVLAAGGTLRLHRRAHQADELAGLYRIRLDIASDPRSNPAGAVIVKDMADMVARLEALPGAEINAWFVHGADDIARYWLFEDRATGGVVACLNYEAQAEQRLAMAQRRGK